MDRQTVIRRLEKYADGAGFMNLVQIAAATGKSRNRILTMMAGTGYWKDGRQKKYVVDDVAAVIMSQMVKK